MLKPSDDNKSIETLKTIYLFHNYQLQPKNQLLQILSYYCLPIDFEVCLLVG